jgi:hypothetical protein
MERCGSSLGLVGSEYRLGLAAFIIGQTTQEEMVVARCREPVLSRSERTKDAGTDRLPSASLGASG